MISSYGFMKFFQVLGIDCDMEVSIWGLLHREFLPLVLGISGRQHCGTLSWLLSLLATFKAYALWTWLLRRSHSGNSRACQALS